jgi:hypothetical protein
MLQVSVGAAAVRSIAHVVLHIYSMDVYAIMPAKRMRMHLLACHTSAALGVTHDMLLQELMETSRRSGAAILRIYDLKSPIIAAYLRTWE